MPEKNVPSFNQNKTIDTALVEENFKENKSQKVNSILTDEFEDEFDPEGIDLKLEYNSSKLLDKTIDANPKNKMYSTIRLVLIGFGIFLLVILGSLSVGYNLLEFNNPDFDIQMPMDRQMANQVSPRFPQILMKPENNKEIMDRIDLQRGRSFVNRIVGVSFEFVVVTAILILLVYLIYRNTDWPLVKNRYFLVLSIGLIFLITGSGFLLLFRQDNKIPRAMRGHRDNIRGRFWPTSPRQP